MGSAVVLLVADSLNELAPTFQAAHEIERARELRARLREWERKYANANADRTVKAVRSDWQVFIGWCVHNAVQPLPVRDTDLLAFLRDRIAAGRKRATIDRYLYTVRLIHEAAGLPDPTLVPDWKLEFRALVKLLAKERRNGKKQAEPLKDDGVLRLLSALDAELEERRRTAMAKHAESNRREEERREKGALTVQFRPMPPSPIRPGRRELQILRDAALVALASDTLCRESELVEVKAQDIMTSADGNYTLYVGHSKNDQDAIGSYRYVSPETKARVDAWVRAMGLHEGFIFIPLGGRPKGADSPPHLLPHEVANIFRRRASRAGIENGDKLTGHSTRVGSAIDLIEGGESYTAAAYAGGWKSDAMVRVYAKRAEVGVSGMARIRGKRRASAVEGETA